MHIFKIKTYFEAKTEKNIGLKIIKIYHVLSKKMVLLLWEEFCFFCPLCPCQAIKCPGSAFGFNALEGIFLFCLFFFCLPCGLIRLLIFFIIFIA